MLPSINKGGNAILNDRTDDDDNESFAQYDLESEASAVKPHRPKQPNSSINEDIIGFKNVLIQAQQEELDNLKNEIVRGTSVYVLMTAMEKAEWDKYKAIDHTFTLVDKLRDSVPPNTKWVDKNVHKVIQSAIELYEFEKSSHLSSFGSNMKDLKIKQEYLNKMISDIHNIDKSKYVGFGKSFTNYYAIILSLLNENCKNTVNMFDSNFEAHEEIMKLKMSMGYLEDETNKLKDDISIKNQKLASLEKEIAMLKSKNSRVFQEN